MYGEFIGGWIAILGIVCIAWEVRKELFLNDEEEK